jgi:Tfp pilus assembly PilM family ATPase
VPRFLALDWAHHRIRVVSASAGRGKVRVEQVASWEEAGVLTPATAEALGQRLRERLKAAGVAAAPLLGCLGRDQVILKEIRYPKADPAQEPALVRFQAAKELTEPADSLVIDYTPLDQAGPGGERRALILVTRRELVGAWKTMCRAAGLKLLALTPRPFALAAGLRLAAPDAPAAPEASALLVAADGWSEFDVVRGDAVLYARPLAAGGGAQFEEVRRNLTLYAGQPQAAPVRALYVAEDGDGALQARLKDVLAIPVRALDPFAGVDLPPALPAERAGFAGAVGLVRLWAARGKAPVNFAAPKEPRPVVNTGRQRAVRLAGLAALAFIAVLFLGNMVLANRRDEVARLKADADDRDSLIRKLEPDKASFGVLSDWHKTDVPVIDELYDLIARFPYQPGIHVTRVDIAPLPGRTVKQPVKANEKEYTVRMVINGVVAPEEAGLVRKLVETINQDPHCRADVPNQRPAGNAGTAGKGQEEFVINVDIAPQPEANYTTRLVVPPAGRFPGRFPGGGFRGGGGFPGGGFRGGFPGGGFPGGGFRGGFPGGGGFPGPGKGAP